MLCGKEYFPAKRWWVRRSSPFLFLVFLSFAPILAELESDSG